MTASAIAGVAAILLFNTSSWGQHDLQEVTTGADTAAAWWHTQTTSWALHPLVDRTFRSWTRDTSTIIGADDVVGIKTHIHEMGSLIEFMAIGTAVKKYPGVTTKSPTLPPQAIINDKNTWITEDSSAMATLNGEKT